MLRRSRRAATLLLTLSLVATACSLDDPVVSDAVVEETGVEDVQGTESVEDVEEIEPAEDAVDEEETAVDPETDRAFASGELAAGSTEVDGVSIDYVVSAPPGFTAGDEAPLLLAFPPGGQDIDLTISLMQGTYHSEAQRLGWVVVSPAAPAGQLFFQGSEALVPGFLDWVETWVSPEGGAPHVAGVSNGGISTFRYGAENPDRVRSMIAFPGFPRSEEDQAALAELTDVPVRIFVGGEDTGWIPQAEETVATLSGLGGDAEVTIFPGEGHVMRSTSDGTIIFELLESFRSS